MRRLLMPSLLVLLAACGGAAPEAPELDLVSAQHTAASAPSPCATCIVDVSVMRTPGPPNTLVHEFTADPMRPYRLTIDVPAGGSPTWVVLNGDSLLTPETLPPGGGPVTVDHLALPASNSLTVRLGGVPGRIARVRIDPLDAGELASCPPWTGTVEPLFTGPLVPLDQLVAIQPLGDLSPPGHTLPTHHTYWDNATLRDSSGRPIVTGLMNVLAPGPIHVVGLIYSPSKDDFEVRMRPCREVLMYLDHIKRLSPALQAAFDAGRLDLFGEVFAVTDLRLDAGAPIGVGGGTPFDEDGRIQGSSGINVGLIDMRRPERPFANPARYRLSEIVEPLLLLELPPEDAARIARDFPPRRTQQFCPLDYFAESLRTQYSALLGSYDGSTRRTTEPRCGDLVHDVAGTLQGNWFEDKPADGFGPEYSNDGDESRLLAFAPDHVNPTTLLLSIGEGVEAPAGSPLDWNIPSGVYGFGTPRPDGRINRPFADVLPGATYCYEGVAPPFDGTTPLAGVILVEVSDASVAQLWIARAPAAPSCAAVADVRIGGSPAARRYVR
jgi:hypothetical protein